MAACAVCFPRTNYRKSYSQQRLIAKHKPFALTFSSWHSTNPKNKCLSEESSQVFWSWFFSPPFSRTSSSSLLTKSHPPHSHHAGTSPHHRVQRRSSFGEYLSVSKVPLRSGMPSVGDSTIKLFLQIISSNCSFWANCQKFWWGSSDNRVVW